MARGSTQYKACACAQGLPMRIWFILYAQRLAQCIHMYMSLAGACESAIAMSVHAPRRQQNRAAHERRGRERRARAVFGKGCARAAMMTLRPYACQSPFVDWAQTAPALSRMHKPGVAWLVCRTAVLRVHAIVNIADANVDGPGSVRVFGHMAQAPCNPTSQQPTWTHTNSTHL